VRFKLCAQNVGNSTTIIHSRQQYSNQKTLSNLAQLTSSYANPVQQKKQQSQSIEPITVHYNKQKVQEPYNTRKTTKYATSINKFSPPHSSPLLLQQNWFAVMSLSLLNSLLNDLVDFPHAELCSLLLKLELL